MSLGNNHDTTQVNAVPQVPLSGSHGMTGIVSSVSIYPVGHVVDPVVITISLVSIYPVGQLAESATTIYSSDSVYSVGQIAYEILSIK